MKSFLNNLKIGDSVQSEKYRNGIVIDIFFDDAGCKIIKVEFPKIKSVINYNMNGSNISYQDHLTCGGK